MPTSPRSFSNVADLERLSETLEIPVLVVVRKHSRPQMVKDALLKRTAGGAEKRWL